MRMKLAMSTAVSCCSRVTTGIVEKSQDRKALETMNFRVTRYTRYRAEGMVRLREVTSELCMMHERRRKEVWLENLYWKSEVAGYEHTEREHSVTMGTSA